MKLNQWLSSSGFAPSTLTSLGLTGSALGRRLVAGLTGVFLRSTVNTLQKLVAFRGDLIEHEVIQRRNTGKGTVKPGLYFVA